MTSNARSGSAASLPATMAAITAEIMREAFGRIEDFRWVHESSDPDPAEILSLLEQGVGLGEEASHEFYAQMVQRCTYAWDAPDRPPPSPERAAYAALIGLYAGLIAAQLAAEKDN